MRCVVAVAVAVAALAVCASADSVLYGIEKLGTVDMNMVRVCVSGRFCSTRC